MEAVSAFFMQNIVYVYFLYGLAFFAMGLVVLLESARATEFRFARALLPLALFALLHGAHEWYEMFQIFAAHGSNYVQPVPVEIVRVAVLAASFLFLVAFGTRLLPDAERHPHASYWQVALMGLLWLAGVGIIYLQYRPPMSELLVSADVLARYSLAIPGALLASWALLRERRDFHARGMSQYGRGLLWTALAFVIYGTVGQLFTRPSLVFPSQTVNTALFLRSFGIPVQLVRGLAAIAIAVTLARALRAFELESRLRLARANKARLEAQAAALEAQERRANEVEALNAQLRMTARELAALVEMSHILTSTMNLHRLLGDALYQIVTSIEGAASSLVCLKRADSGLDMAGEYSLPSVPQPFTSSLAPCAVQAVETGLPAGVRLDGDVETIADIGFASGPTYYTLAVPLQTKGEVLGGLALSSLGEEVPLGPEELDLLTAFAQQVAASLDSARLYQALQEREVQLEKLIRQLVNAQEGERQRIARELHDETGQKLTALAMGLAAVESRLDSDDFASVGGLVRNLRDVADQAMIELRNVMSNLRPAQLDDLGLVPALRWYVGQFAARHPELHVTLNADRLPQRLSPEYETVMFRVAQEALTNVVRHAYATQVTVALAQGGAGVCLQVCDNGVGFDVNAPVSSEGSGGWGLMGIRERVALVGGRCTVMSQPRQGTRLVVELPEVKRET
jgi:signal transduction histidine kinase